MHISKLKTIAICWWCDGSTHEWGRLDRMAWCILKSTNTAKSK